MPITVENLVYILRSREKMLYRKLKIVLVGDKPNYIKKSFMIDVICYYYYFLNNVFLFLFQNGVYRNY